MSLRKKVARILNHFANGVQVLLFTEQEFCRVGVRQKKLRYSNRMIQHGISNMITSSISVKIKAAGISSGLVSLGGDIVAFGSTPGNAPWPVGIVHPTQRDAVIATIYLQDRALATSGGYERYFEMQGKRYSHLINPHTGWPVDSLLSVSVSADQAIVAGSISSIGLLFERHEALEWLERSGCDYLAVDQDLSCYGTLAD